MYIKKISSNFDAVFFFEFIVPRASGSVSMYFLLSLVFSEIKPTVKDQQVSNFRFKFCIFHPISMQFHCFTK